MAGQVNVTIVSTYGATSETSSQYENVFELYKAIYLNFCDANLAFNMMLYCSTT